MNIAGGDDVLCARVAVLELVAGAAGKDFRFLFGWRAWALDRWAWIDAMLEGSKEDRARGAFWGVQSCFFSTCGLCVLCMSNMFCSLASGPGADTGRPFVSFGSFGGGDGDESRKGEAEPPLMPSPTAGRFRGCSGD